MSAGEHISLEGDSVAALIKRDGVPARLDTLDDAVGSTAARVRALGIRSAVGAPIIVDGNVWGALVVGSAQPAPLAPSTEQRIGDFADLVATAIFNAETRAELAASRARIISAADQARRRIERDLHDGAQQRVVSLGLQLRSIEAALPLDEPSLQQQFAELITALAAIAENLREISRGIHPAILSKGGLAPPSRRWPAALLSRSPLTCGSAPACPSRSK